ncbi:MAG TPA: efflux RND transporter permease subunit, partial [Terriglobales bacterium]|nr:efflux RND transporter permease subunit [Terriglobales bacterium]
VALTLSPMMCRFMLKREGGHSWFYRWSEPFFEALTAAYRRTLQSFLRLRWLVLPLTLATAVGIVLCLRGLPSELAPLEDRSNIRVNVRAPEGASFDYMQDQLDRIAVYVRDEIPEVEHAFAIGGPRGGTAATGRFSLYLKDPHDRERTQEQVFQQLSRDLDRFNGVRAFPAQVPTIGDRRAGLPVQYVLQSPTLEDLVAVLPRFLEESSQSSVLRFVDSDFKLNRPEGAVSIDRRRAAELGVSVQDIARTLQLAYGGQRFGFFLMNDRQYSVIGQVERADRNDPGDLAKLFVRARGGAMVSLDNLLHFEETVGPASILRFNRFTSATISAGTAPGHTLGDGIAAFDEVAARVLPAGIRTSLAGQSRDFADASSSLIFAFGFALALIYLVLAAQFESFRDPLIILITVPLSLAGALVSLWVFGQTINVFSQIGLIMLIGLVTKNGILIVEFANQQRERGLAIMDAALEASAARLRPILMTALSTILGVLPIALSLGDAAGSRQSLGVAVVGGMMLSTFLTLYLVPAVYTYLTSARREVEGITEGVSQLRSA